jgi:hypothetical protein
MKWAALPALLIAGPLAAATLEGFASLPADTLMPGPSSGHFIEPPENIEPPFQGQPAQGYSAVINNGDGSFLFLSDNGYGKGANSLDFLLRTYCISPDFRTAEGGSGEIRIDGYLDLSDPQQQNPYRPTVAESTTGQYTPDESILTRRLLTGAHFDPESIQRATDGSLWVGDETGPFLLHFNARGELLEEPYQLQGLVSPGRSVEPAEPAREEPVMRRSKGFEGMAISPSGHMLYPMLEAALLAQPGHLNIYSFSLEREEFLNRSALKPSYRYALDPGATAIGAFQMYSDNAGLVLERDSGSGEKARHKKVYRIDFQRLDTGGLLLKEEVADLLNIDDPHDLDGDGSTRFSFPFHTPEGLVIIDSDTIGIINDNNFPFGRGRKETAGSENTEFILLGVDDLW